MSDLELAKELIEAEKHPAKPLEMEYIEKQIYETLKLEHNKLEAIIVDRKRSYEYQLSINITPIETRFSINVYLPKLNKILIRYDFGETLRHKNNYGTDKEYVVIGSHIHIMCEPEKTAKKDVYPIKDIKEFKNIYRIIEAYGIIKEQINLKIK